MAAKQPVAIGMVGCGFYAQNHLNAWADLKPEGALLSAVCDRDEARAAAAGKAFGVPHFTHLGQMLDTVKIDLLDIATRMDTHKELAAIAAERGVAAVVQKPFAPTWEDCVAIVEKARTHNAWLAVHENFRFASAMRAVKKILDQGTIGTPTWARLSWRTGFDVYRGQPYLAEEEKLVIQDVGIHILDLARYFLGEVAHLSCETQKRNPKIRAEDTATILMRHTSGAVSVVEASYGAKRRDDAFPETMARLAGGGAAHQPPHVRAFPRRPRGGYLGRGQPQDLCTGGSRLRGGPDPLRGEAPAMVTEGLRARIT
ncbi:MAG: Gfo/Idh/MocA family oxidoreductase [Alphaproteobacteria bacterium]|nr:Gfo/Idh/MocA family oxidoreductase [Alphaproteobacteria bacterium]